MNAKDKLKQLDENQASEILKMAEVGYKVTQHKTIKKGEKTSGAYDALMNMIGCNEAKETARKLLATVRMNRINEVRGHYSDAEHYHMVFQGAPGSNKTSVAKLFAEILYDEGVTKNKKLVVLTRAMLVGQYQGHTALQTRTEILKARGGTILIDEAYSLDDTDKSNSGSYGRECIDELIVQLEDLTDTVIIFAGYPDRMQSFLDANPGLRSRVQMTVSFPDYTTTELLEICRKLAGDRGYIINSSAENKIAGILENAKLQDNFGNGRYCRNLVEDAIRAKSLQLGLLNEDFDITKYINTDEITDEELYTLNEKCFEEKPVQAKEKKHTIGF